MGKYDDSDLIVTKGTITKLKLNADLKMSNGDGTFKGNLLVIENSEGEEVKFKISAKAPPAKYMDKLKVGDKVTVKQKDDKFKNVIMIFNDSFQKGSFKKGGFAKTNYTKDTTGMIQGMILKAAIDVAISSGETKKTELIELIVDAAKQILLAKVKVDKLVVQALKTKDDNGEDEDDDTDDDSDTSDEDSDDVGDSDDEDEKPKKKSSKSKSKVKDEDSEDEEESPY